MHLWKFNMEISVQWTLTTSPPLLPLLLVQCSTADCQGAPGALTVQAHEVSLKNFQHFQQGFFFSQIEKNNVFFCFSSVLLSLSLSLSLFLSFLFVCFVFVQKWSVLKMKGSKENSYACIITTGTGFRVVWGSLCYFSSSFFLSVCLVLCFCLPIHLCFFF